MTNETTAKNSIHDESDLIAGILSSFCIVDYGYVNKVNADGTVDVTHAIRTIMKNGTELSETITPGVEVLTFSGAGFALKWDITPGDRVLLLGLKDYIPKVGDVSKAEAPKAYVHYERANLKAMPLCVFNDSAKTVIQSDKGKFSVTSNKIELNGNTKQFVTWAELNAALSSFITALNNHTHTNGNQGAPTGPVIAPLSLDISAAKSKTVVTGG